MKAADHQHPAKSTGLRWAIATIGGVCAAIGVWVIAGWLLIHPAVTPVRLTMPPMPFNTALCFILAGAALALRVSERTAKAVPFLGALILLDGTATLAEQLFHLHLGMDQWLGRNSGSTSTPYPGSMSPVSSLCVLFGGGALVLLGMPLARWWKGLAAGSLASITISISLVALFGYGLGLPGTYGWGELSRTAVRSAGTFALFGTGLFLIAWNVTRRRGERTPRWLPFPLALLVFTASLALYFALKNQQDEEIARTVKAAAESAHNQISVRMENRIRGLARMTRRWEFAGEGAQAAWAADAADYLHDQPDLDALEWMDSTHGQGWVVPKGNANSSGNSDGNEVRDAAIMQAGHEREPIVSHILHLAGGELGFVVYVPVIIGGQAHGLLAATFNAQASLDRYLPDAVATAEAIQLSEDDAIFYRRDASAQPAHQGWVAEDKIDLPGARWTLRVWPTATLAQRLDSPLPAIVLWAGVLGAILLGVVCYLAQRSSRQAAETTQFNRALQAALDQVKTLEGLLPICCSCKRVRDDTGYWNEIDTYIRRHTRASVSHGYCPQCAAKEFEKHGLEIPEKIQEQLKAGYQVQG